MGRREGNIFAWSGILFCVVSSLQSARADHNLEIGGLFHVRIKHYYFWRILCSPSLDGWIHRLFPHVIFNFRFTQLIANSPTSYTKVIQKRSQSPTRSRNYRQSACSHLSNAPTRSELEERKKFHDLLLMNSSGLNFLSQNRLIKHWYVVQT